MYILTNQAKRKLGLLIEYYRKQYWKVTKDKTWQKNNFLKDKNGNQICSDKTYYKIIRGEVLTNDDVYDKLLAKLNENFVVPKGLLSTLMRLMKSLIQAIEFRNELEIDELTTKMLQCIQKYRHIIYYREIDELIHIARDYYIYGILMSQNQYEKYLNLLDVFYEETQTLMKGLLFRYCQYTFFDYSKLKQLYLDLHIESETAMFHQLSKLQIAILDHTLFEARELANGMMHQARLTKNYNIKATVMSLDLMTTWMADRDHFDEKWCALSDLLFDDTKRISKHVKSKCLINTGFLLYNANQKEQAYYLFRNAILYWPQNFHFVGLYIKHIEDLLGLPKTNYGIYEKHRYPERFQVLYRYYELRHDAGLENIHKMTRVSHRQKEELRKLELYLSNEVMPIIRHSENRLIQIFMWEINVIASLLQSYATYRKYFMLEKEDKGN